VVVTVMPDDRSLRVRRALTGVRNTADRERIRVAMMAMISRLVRVKEGVKVYYGKINDINCKT